MIAVRLTANLSNEEIEDWIKQAYYLGWAREEPRKRWTANERKEAIRFAMTETLRRHIASNQRYTK